MTGGRLPLTVVGGYLGAGKTTLINALLADPAGERIAVLVNDFGDIDIDARLMDSGDADVMSLTNGCICCSLADGFAEALDRIRDLAGRIDRVVIEVSGVGDPRKVAQWGHVPGFTLDGVVVLVDAETVRAVEAVLRERLKAGAGMLFVSHDEDQAGRLSRRGLRVAEGVVTEGVL